MSPPSRVATRPLVRLVALAACLPWIVSLTGCGTNMPELKPVEHVDLSRFMGRWYVIANIPTFLEKNAYNAVETYAMNEDGTPRAESIRMVGSDGGGEAAARKVFDTARRAILRCGARGFPLPSEKYDQWRQIEMRFNPEGMFLR